MSSLRVWNTGKFRLSIRSGSPGTTRQKSSCIVCDLHRENPEVNDDNHFMLTQITTAFLTTDLGTLRITGTDRGIDSVTFASPPHTKPVQTTDILERALQELRGYFLGDLHRFSVPLVMRDTDFQQRVWDALLTIPFGSTITYGDLAKEIGKPDAVRAVGTAVGDNPLTIVILCHRVLPASGGIGNYASGSDKKEWLLKHEGVVC